MKIQLHKTATQSASNADAENLVAFAVAGEDVKTGLLHDDTNPERVTIPTGGAGFYHWTGTVDFGSDTTGHRIVAIHRYNSSDVLQDRVICNYSPASGAAVRVQGAADFQMSDGDYAVLNALHTSSGSLTLATTWTKLSGFRVCL